MGTVDLETAREALKKAQNSAQMHILAQWASHRIPGPDCYETWMKIAKKAEGLSRFLESKGLYDQADSQMRRSEEASDRAQSLIQRGAL